MFDLNFGELLACRRCGPRAIELAQSDDELQERLIINAHAAVHHLASRIDGRPAVKGARDILRAVRSVLRRGFAFRMQD